METGLVAVYSPSTPSTILRTTREDEDIDRNKVLSVAASSNVKALAGSIAHTARGVSAPILQAVGAASLNQAIKSVALSRAFLIPDGMDFEIEVSRVPNEKIRNLIQLRLHRVNKTKNDPTTSAEPIVDFRAAAKTETSSLAGAIAKNIRDGNRVAVTAIGPVPIFRAVDAVAKARQFLNKDAIDIVFVPDFKKITAPTPSMMDVVGEQHGSMESGESQDNVIKAMQLIVCRPSFVTDETSWSEAEGPPLPSTIDHDRHRSDTTESKDSKDSFVETYTGGLPD